MAIDPRTSLKPSWAGRNFIVVWDFETSKRLFGVDGDEVMNQYRCLTFQQAEWLAFIDHPTGTIDRILTS